MADRAYAYCPMCRNSSGAKVEAMRDSHMMNCLMGHSMTQEQFWSMNPEKIKLDAHFKPGPNDVKAEVWVNSEIYMKAKEILGVQFHRTMDSLMRVAMTGDFIIVDGIQAEKLRAKHIKNGAEMLACAEECERLEAEREMLKDKLDYFESIFKRAAEGVPA